MCVCSLIIDLKVYVFKLVYMVIIVKLSFVGCICLVFFLFSYWFLKVCFLNFYKLWGNENGKGIKFLLCLIFVNVNYIYV